MDQETYRLVRRTLLALALLLFVSLIVAQTFPAAAHQGALTSTVASIPQ